jgi:hypothetical protein
MRKAQLLMFAILAVAIASPLGAANGNHQSYFSFDNGGTLVRPSGNEREVQARVNLPVYPGDEIITDRGGRSEIRLSDGNLVAVDRATALAFQAILDSYEGDSSETIAELRYGKIAVFHAGHSRDHIRVDTRSATYFASTDALFSVETDSGGRDRVVVFDGSIEVRMPEESTRLNAGEQAELDDRGGYVVAEFSRHAADDFEGWFSNRAERYGEARGQHLDRSLAYYEDELNDNGSWVYLSAYGWSWRPTVSIGWRPYYNGYWYSGYGGYLSWVSYEPWGWVPYHYGRWAYDPFYGWFWVPGAGYAPAWVYWWYGPGYIGWAPAGWWDCYGPYYGWAYHGYSHHRKIDGEGFYGHVAGRDVDLKPWTFVDPKALLSPRIDKSSLSQDMIRTRLTKDGGKVTISNEPAKFTRDEWNDPTSAVNKRWKGVDTGRTALEHPGEDLTPFIKRDADLPAGVKDQVARGKSSGKGSIAGRGTLKGGSLGNGGLAPIGGGSVAPIKGDEVAPIRGGPVAPIGSEGGKSPDKGDSSGKSEAPRKSESPAKSDAIDRNEKSTPGNWRQSEPDKGESKGTSESSGGSNSKSTIRKGSSYRSLNDGSASGGEWRDRSRVAPRSQSPPKSSGAQQKDWRSGLTERKPLRLPSSSDDNLKDVPRRVIDRIGGARVQNDDGSRSSGKSQGRGRVGPPPSYDRGGKTARSSSPPPRSGYSGGSKGSSGGSRSTASGGGSKGSSGGGARSSGGGGKSSGGGGKSSGGGGGKSGGGGGGGKSGGGGKH